LERNVAKKDWEIKELREEKKGGKKGRVVMESIQIYYTFLLFKLIKESTI